MMSWTHRTRLRLGVAGFVAAVVVASSTSHPSAQSQDKLKDQRNIAEGAKLFAPTCGTGYCHGSGGSGGGAPKLRGRGLEPDYVFKTISNGIRGTAMIPFKSQYSEEQIWKLVAFIISDAPASIDAGSAGTEPNKTDAATVPVSAGTSSSMSGSSMIGDAKTGRSLFFDSDAKYNCAACHAYGGEGGSIGPDLGKAVNGISAAGLFRAITIPGISSDGRYQTIAVTLRSGERIKGLKKEDDGESVRVYDTTELPPVLRTIQKSDIARLDKLQESVMPGDYAARYTLKQLLDIVTFLKSDAKQSVTLADMLTK